MRKKASEDYADLVRRVLRLLNRLTVLPNLHFTSIAKAIESASKDRRRIIFRAMPRASFEGIYPYGVTLTQELEARLPGAEHSRTMYEHLLYYPIGEGGTADATDRMTTRFSVAHELGHILMHMPDRAAEHPRVFHPLGDSESLLYLVDYSEREETEADLFATVLCDQRPAPMRSEVFRAPCIREVRHMCDLGLIRSELSKIRPTHDVCLIDAE